MSVIENIENPKLSVVVASQNARRSAADCLQEIESQCTGNTVEIIVVDNSTDGTQDIIAREFPQVKLIRAPTDKLIPELWGMGIGESFGNYVAVTTTHFVPSKKLD